MRPRLLLTINCKFAVDFFARGLHARTAVARLPLRQLGFLVKCSLHQPKRAFYRAANGLFGKIARTTSKDAVIQLLISKCMPIMLYGLGVCCLRKAEVSSLDFIINRFCMKLFRTNKPVGELVCALRGFPWTVTICDKWHHRPHDHLFVTERLSQSSCSNPRFSLCCGDGKVKLCTVPEPPEPLATLLTDWTRLPAMDCSCWCVHRPRFIGQWNKLYRFGLIAARNWLFYYEKYSPAW